MVTDKPRGFYSDGRLTVISVPVTILQGMVRWSLSRCGAVIVAPRGQALRPQGSSGKEELSRFARGEVSVRFPSVLRPDPAPLRFWEGSAGSGVRTQGSSGEKERSRFARGEVSDRFPSVLRPDPAPLRFWEGSAGSRRLRPQGSRYWTFPGESTKLKSG